MQELFTSSPTLFVVVAFLFALLIGSFLNVVIFRLPVMMQRDWREQAKEVLADETELPEGRFDLLMPRSRCGNCGHQITALQNIPVVSWLLLRGKCANCGTKISSRYPAVEFATALMTAVVAWRFGFGYEALAAAYFTWVLIAVSMIDVDHQLIPDSMSLPLIWVGLALSLFFPMEGSEVLFIAPKDAIVGALIGYLSLWSIYWLFKLVTGKEGMGYGDFKLLAAIGAWLGWQSLGLVILLSAVVGAVVGILLIVTRKQDRSVPIPFGPYLAMAGWIAMIWGTEILTWYSTFWR